MIWFIFILLYILSCVGVYLFVQKAHYHPQGEWRYTNPNNIDIFFMFCPFINMIFATQYFTDEWKDKKYKNPKPEKEPFAVRFFKPKKYQHGSDNH